jgi:hypothetical protein
MKVQKELYSIQTLFTLGGASFAVLVASGVIAHVFEINPKWLALLRAELIAFAGLAAIPKELDRVTFPLCLDAFFNGALIYAQAVGLNTLNHAAGRSPAKQAQLIPVIDPVPWWIPNEVQRT